MVRRKSPLAVRGFGHQALQVATIRDRSFMGALRRMRRTSCRFAGRCVPHYSAGGQVRGRFSLPPAHADDADAVAVDDTGVVLQSR